MGQKVRPTGFRVGVMENWRSRWYAPKREFGDLLAEDFKIRKYVSEKYQFAEIAKVEIEPKIHLNGTMNGIRMETTSGID